MDLATCAVIGRHVDPASFRWRIPKLTASDSSFRQSRRSITVAHFAQEGTLQLLSLIRQSAATSSTRLCRQESCKSSSTSPGGSKVIEKYFPRKATAPPFSDLFANSEADNDIALRVDQAARAMGPTMMVGLATKLHRQFRSTFVLLQALQDSATRHHSQPFETRIPNRYRVDGRAYEIVASPQAFDLPGTRVSKVRANLNIRKAPPSRRALNFSMGIAGGTCAVSTLPTQFGASIVLRVLSIAVNWKSNRSDSEVIYDPCTEAVQRPTAFSSPPAQTGCGKTTTLYSCMRETPH